MGSLGSILGGGPSADDVNAANKLVGPNQSNYQIGGIPAYQQGLNGYSGQANQIANNGAGNYNSGAAGAGLGQQAAATNLIAQTAAGNGPSLARANMQAGLSQQAAQLQSQAMTNQGNTAGGLSQRNLLNAQSNAGNAMVQNAGTASVAEQLGAQSNYASAANAQAQGQMANAQNAANTGLAQNQQALGAAQFGAQNLTLGQQQNDQQTQANMGYDAANMQNGMNQTNIGLQAASANANQLGAFGKFAGNVAMGAAVASDEETKTAIRQGSATDSQIGKFLKGFSQGDAGAKGGAKSDAGVAAAEPNPYSTFQPAMLRMGSGVLQNGGVKQSFDGGVNGSGVGQGAGKGFMGMLHKAAPAAAPVAAASAMPMAPDTGQSASMTQYMPVDPGMDPALGNFGTRSDERCKTDKAPASDSQLSSFMGAMDPSTFKYKDQSYSPGTHMGVMAQDVDDSKIGADMVQDTPQGKMINVPKAMGATLASLAYLNEKVDKLSGKKGGANA